MKKRNLLIVSLLVLSLSVVLMGCPPDDEPTKFDEAMDAIKALGYDGDLIQPSVGEFHDYAKDSSSVTLAWSSQTMASYNSYKTSWASKYGTASVKLGRAVLEFADPDWFDLAGPGDLKALGDFFETEGEVGSLSVPAKSIVIKVYQ